MPYWISRPLLRLLRRLIYNVFLLQISVIQAQEPVDWKAFFPDADRLGQKEASPPVWPVYRDSQVIGYLFESIDLAAIPAFSGQPVNLLIGIDNGGLFTGVRVLHHHEPIFLHGLGETPLFDFVRQYQGLLLTDPIRVARSRGAKTAITTIDGITKATASVIVINESILISAMKVARGKLAGMSSGEAAKIREDLFEPLDFESLEQRKFVRRLRLNGRDIRKAFHGTDAEGMNPEGLSDAQSLFIDLRYAYLNVPSVGRNLLGEADYALLQEALEPGEQAIAVFSRGPYSFAGEDFVPASEPDRLSLRQNGLAIDIRDMNFYDLDPVQSPYLPDFDSVKFFRIKAETEFNPGAPWEISLIVSRQKNPLSHPVNITFTGDYQLPPHLFTFPSTHATEDNQTQPPFWLSLWESRITEVIILLIGLVVLTLLFTGQHWLVKYSRWFHRLRWGYLWFTLIFIGWYAQGQLSVVNIFPILQSLYRGFQIEAYLVDPVIFILWLYVVVSLVLWGRGLFCGWLCPFGALQEMVSWLAKQLRIPQFRVPYRLHTRLWKLKYVILVVLAGLSFYAMSAAEKAAEIEPFKTAITLYFIRSWPFVLYAVLLLVTGLFIHKFFCRYLCPLGAGLAVLGYFRRFSWLTRRQECGSPCQLCRRKCEIDAIHPDGKIDYNECIQCLECIVYYENDDLCAPQVIKSRKLDKAASEVELIYRSSGI